MRKTVIGSASPSSFSFSVTGPAIPFESDGENELQLPAGTYSVSEVAAPPGYVATYSGCTNIMLESPQSEVPVCTITNTAAAPAPQAKLIVQKVVDGADAVASDFSFRVDGGRP